YSTEGRTNRVTDARGVTESLYDWQDRLVRMTSPDGVINYAYDDATNRLNRVWTVASDIQYGYDTAGRLSTVTVVKQGGVTLASPQQALYVYDAVGNISELRRSVGSTVTADTTYTYDQMNRIKRLINSTGAGVILSDQTYTRGATGNVDTITESRRQSGGSYDTYSTSYSYDALDRLTQEIFDAPGTANDSQMTYTFDVVGNRLSDTTVQSSGTTVRTYQYNALNQLLQLHSV